MQASRSVSSTILPSLWVMLFFMVNHRRPATGRAVRQAAEMSSGSPVRWPWPFCGPGQGTGGPATARQAEIERGVLYNLLFLRLSNILLMISNINFPNGVVIPVFR